MNATPIKTGAKAVAFIIINGFLLGEGRAALTMTLDGAPGSSIVHVSLSGSSVAAASSGAIINFGWSFLPTTFNPFPAQITGGDFGMFNFTSGSAVYRNVTRGLTTTVSGIWLQDSSNSPMPGSERFGVIETSLGDNAYHVGDLIEWSGSATIDLSGKGLTFGDLHPGSSGPVSGDLNILVGQLTIVPEPLPGALLLTFGAVAAILRRRAKSNRAPLVQGCA